MKIERQLMHCDSSTVIMTVVSFGMIVGLRERHSYDTLMCISPPDPHIPFQVFIESTNFTEL